CHLFSPFGLFSIQLFYLITCPVFWDHYSDNHNSLIPAYRAVPLNSPVIPIRVLTDNIYFHFPAQRGKINCQLERGLVSSGPEVILATFFPCLRPSNFPWKCPLISLILLYS